MSAQDDGRRTCANCGVGFRVFMVRDPRTPARSPILHHADQAGTFCTIACAAGYGLSCHRAGVRLTDGAKL